MLKYIYLVSVNEMYYCC